MLRKYRSASWALMDQAVVSAANFLTIFLFARHMKAADFGALMLGHTGLLFITGLQTSLVTRPHNILGAQLEGLEYTRFTRGAAIVQGLASLFLSALVAMVGALIWNAYSIAAGSILVALALTAIPWMAQEFVRRVLYTRSESRAAFINDCISYGLQLLGAVALTVNGSVTQATPEAAFFVLGGSSLIAAIVGAWQLREYILIPWDDRDSRQFQLTWAELWNFGKWTLAQNIVGWFGSSGHGWVLAAFVGTEKFGSYRAAYQIVAALNPLNQVTLSYLPTRASVTYAKQGTLGLHRWLKKTTLMLFIPFFVCAMAIAALSDPLLTIAYGDKYADMGLEWIIVLGAISYVINFARYPLEFGVLAMGGSKAAFLRSIISSSLFLTLGVWLIYIYGIYGTVISQVIIATVLLIVMNKIYSDLAAKSKAGS